MINQNEVILLLLGAGVLVFMLGHQRRLQRFPAAHTLFAGFYILFAGWILTILEAFLLPAVLNLMEHGCYAVSAVLLAVWGWKVFGRTEKAP